MNALEFLEELLSLRENVCMIDIKENEICLLVPKLMRIVESASIKIRRDENNFFVVELSVQDDYYCEDIDEPKRLLFLTEKEVSEFKNAKEFMV